VGRTFLFLNMVVCKVMLVKYGYRGSYYNHKWTVARCKH
jgi:hypothetical protein